MIISKLITGLMSHLGNDIFRESIREARVEKIYESINGTPQKKEVKLPITALPKSDDVDYWKERQDEADRLKEVYYEAQLYRDL